jgi:hypothetical protein
MDQPSTSASILGLVVLPQLLHVLPQDLRKEIVRVAILHLGVELRDETRLQGVAVVQEPRRDVVPLIPLVTLPRLHPVPRRLPGLQTHVVGDALPCPFHCHTCITSWYSTPVT